MPENTPTERDVLDALIKLREGTGDNLRNVFGQSEDAWVILKSLVDRNIIDYGTSPWVGWPSDQAYLDTNYPDLGERWRKVAPK